MSTLNTDTVSVSPDVELALGVKDRFGWTLFTDWCAAADRTALPAEPVTLAQFIAENSAALLTQRRRISTVNAVHRAAGHPEPGRADTIRRMVNTSRSDRLSILETVVAQIIPRLPVFGWTGGLFGRRDALLLLLASSGLSFEQISAVHRNNIRFDRDIVVVDGVHPVRLDPDTYHAKISPADVYRRWAQIPEFLDRTPSTRLLAEHLDAHTLPVNAMTIEATGAVTGRKQTGPLFTPIDRWGFTPISGPALTAQSVSSIVNAHLAGTSPPHHPRPQRPRRPDTPDYEPEVFRDIDLDDNYYESGLEARRTAHAALTDVTAALAHVEDRADEILRKLLAVLDTEP
ncbi:MULTISPECIES: recombinase [Rhodococcus]|uniref:Recombinase n=1 Tax=Rhodococcus erythropolis TaxID=1833 RepID=A0A8I0ZKH0_RHOER|nr:recombinase [Rhodococcus erythropolis]MBH5141171.1 recombinase [Rhodococcus erythropolis]